MVLNIYIRKPEIPVVLVNQMFRAIPIGKLQSYREDITRWREDMNFIFDWQNNIKLKATISIIVLVIGKNDVHISCGHTTDFLPR